MAKKRKGRLVPVKKTVLDPRLGKSIERTYYINPDKRKTKPKRSKEPDLQQYKENLAEIGKMAEKMFLCNW